MCGWLFIVVSASCSSASEQTDAPRRGGPFYTGLQVNPSNLTVALSGPIPFSGSHPVGSAYWDLGDRIARVEFDQASTVTSDMIRIDEDRHVVYRISPRTLGRVAGCTAILEIQFNYGQDATTIERRLSLFEVAGASKFPEPTSVDSDDHTYTASFGEVFLLRTDRVSGAIIGGSYDGNGMLRSVYYASPRHCGFSITYGLSTSDRDLQDEAERRGVAARIDVSSPEKWLRDKSSTQRVAWGVVASGNETVVQFRWRGNRLESKPLRYEASRVDMLFAGLDDQ